jgi:V8-like Glu-specific endopeptidase
MHFGKRVSRVAGGFLVASIAAVIGFLPVLAHEDVGATSGSASIVHASGITTASSTSTARTRAPFTAAEMAAAKPYPMPEQQGTGSAQGSPVAARATGAPSTSPGFTPAGLDQIVSGGVHVARTQGLSNDGTSILATGVYPSPFDRWEYFAKYRVFPISPIGKLFFTQGGQNFVCSAATVGTNEIWTAGHCTSAGGGGPFDSFVEFCPSYDSSQGGVNPNVGCWFGDGNMAVSTAWFNDGCLNRDLGAIHINPNGTLFNTSIGNVTGFEGFAWNFARDQHKEQFGYPAAAPFTGGKIIQVASEWWATENGGACPTDPNAPASDSFGNDMTGGSSGGPHLLSFGNGNFINGHNDWRFNARPQEMNSPYFDDLANNVRLAENF